MYTCAPSNANPISVRVHILNGKLLYLCFFFFSISNTISIDQMLHFVVVRPDRHQLIEWHKEFIVKSISKSHSILAMKMKFQKLVACLENCYRQFHWCNSIWQLCVAQNCIHLEISNHSYRRPAYVSIWILVSMSAFMLDFNKSTIFFFSNIRFRIDFSINQYMQRI